jgi:hypothetical protein
MDSTYYFTGTGRRRETRKPSNGLCYCAYIVGHGRFICEWAFRRQIAIPLLAILLFATCTLPSAFAQSQERDDEIVTSLAGGRVILLVAKEETIFFAAIDQPVEQGAPPPRVVDLDSQHVAILFGASEWRAPADPRPVRMDRDFHRIAGVDQRNSAYNGEADPDLEILGTAFLEKLRPLVSQLRHKIDFPSDQPIFEMVVIGYGPNRYGPEAWTVEFRITQELLTTRDNYWQTRLLRPRFTQIYPPEKKAPKTLVEATFPTDAQGPTLQTLLEGNDPRFSPLRSDLKIAKAIDLITKGQAPKAEPLDAQEFLRAAIPLLYPKQRFFIGKMEEQRGFDWILPPEEPVQKADKDDKNRPPEAPSLRKRPDN